MHRLIKRLVGRLIDRMAERTGERITLCRPAPAQVPVESVEEAAEKAGYASCLEKALASASGKTPHELFGDIGDDFWWWLNTEGCRESPGLRAILPGLPDERLQLEAVALKGEEALKQGFSVYTLFRRLYQEHKGNLATCEAVLDFGCGWGRVLRFFLRDLPPSRLLGLDAWDEMIEAGRQVNPWCHFSLVAPMGPAPFPTNSFDWIYSHSVFSHLTEEVHRKWLVEFNRLLKPDGLLIVTTRGRDFMQDVGALRQESAPPVEDALLAEHYQVLADLFQDTDWWLAEYDRGNYCFDTCPRYGSYAGVTAYGETCIPKGYVQKHWARYFTLVDYLDDRNQCEQNIIVAVNRKCPEVWPGATPPAGTAV